MKKTTNMLEYLLKGELVSCEDQVMLTQVVKKDDVVEDSLDLQTFVQDIVKFCTANIGKNIELKFSLKEVVEE